MQRDPNSRPKMLEVRAMAFFKKELTCEEADNISSVLMGDMVEPSRDFINNNALNVLDNAVYTYNNSSDKDNVIDYETSLIINATEKPGGEIRLIGGCVRDSVCSTARGGAWT
ncbi:unnamed protein product [Onchocerca flexuosa]|uniref:PolyA_pol domain-containing protein n=1 Tax=Onchocerca flexuosa TaxID=387005 RepID=A0A183HE07_9BILA|nr:unnamed protein product [Onchocerca flexuosa]